jgi:hypothetical protein
VAWRMNFEGGQAVALHLLLWCLRRSLGTVWAKRGEGHSKRYIDAGEILLVPATLSRPSPNILMIVQSGRCHCLIARSWLECLCGLLPPARNKHKLETEV